MATASGTAFGATSGLFGTTSTGTPAFGTQSTALQPAGSGFSFSGAKPATTTSAPGFSFGPGSQPSAPSTSTGFGLATFGAKPSASVSAFSVTTTSQPQGFGSLSAPSTSTATSSSLFGSSLFGANATATTTGTSLQLQTSSSGSQGLSLFGNTSNLGTTQQTVSTAGSAAGQKVPDNPKDAQVAQPLMQAYQEVSKHIKDQRARKDEITRYSAKLIVKASEEIATLKQLLSEVSTGMQKDAVGVETLKAEVSQEFSFAEVARRLHEVPASLQHDYTAPMEYFSLLVINFELRIKAYRQQLDELEMYLSAPTQMNNFSPQDLFNVLRQLNDTFLALAAQLHGIHEAIQTLKNKYLHYRAVVLNDTTEVFATKSRAADRDNTTKGSGPSPFAGLAGPSAVTMAAALNQSKTGKQSSTATATFSSIKVGQTSIAKPGSSLGSIGMSRSLSFSGLSSRGTGNSLSLGSSLIGSSFGDFSTSLKTTQFQLQNPPGFKRGRKD